MKNTFKVFKEECLRLQKEWGLGGWQLLFEIGSKKDSYATVQRDEVHHKVMISFNSKAVDEWFDVKETAKHEMIHVIIARLAELGSSRFVRGNELEEAEEEVVQILLKII